jgi:pyruvate dehydrogenase E2 component (dihydrolipoamide acetyltransferase)
MTDRTFALPDVGEGVSEGELLRWLVEVGDRVAEDQPVAEVETDKAVVELPSPYAGTVAERHADPGDIVPVGDPLITIDDGGAAGDADDEATTGDADAETNDDWVPTDGAGDAAADRVFAPPRTRRLARELGVDVRAVEGTGPSGRVTDSDVREAAEAAEDDDAPTPRSLDDDATRVVERREADRLTPVEDEVVHRESADSVDRAAAAVPDDDPIRDHTLAAPATRRLAEELGVDLDAVPTDRARDGVPFVTPTMVHEFAERRREGDAEAAADDATGGDADADAEAAAEPEAEAETESGPRPGDRIPYRGVRRTIGERMEAAAEIPRVTHTDEVDVTALVETREDLLGYAEEEGVRLTYLPFVVRAVVRALAEYPTLNATLDEGSEEIVLHDEYNVGVATDTDAGLLVPVVEDADDQGLLDLAASIERATARARRRDIDREEMQGGTFTVTNLGAVGGRFATPMVNPPEVAILALGRIERRPRVVGEEVVARHTLPLSLSVDHRVVDGATAARFTNRVMELLANPGRLLVED